MKTIEERAREFAAKSMSLFMDSSDEQDIYCEDLIMSYAAGAKSERAELTRWNDPDESRPENMQRVLVKYKKADGSTKVGIATFHHPFDIGRGSFVMEASRPQYIIGWRPIHE